MNLAPLFRILAARWLVVAIALACSLAGGAVVILISPPKYQAHARVTLDFIKPDPITGAVVPSKMADAYVTSQANMIQDYQVAGPAAEAMGWMDDPDVAFAYAQISRGSSDPDSFRRWLAARIINNTFVSMVEGSNILEIRYRAPTKAMAVAVVDALRTSYIQTTANIRRSTASGRADLLEKQSQVVRTRLNELQNEKTAFEGKTGLMMQNARDGDLDSQMLDRLARGSADTHKDKTGLRTTELPSLLATAQVDLHQAQAVYGPNSPTLQALKDRVDSLKSRVAQQTDAGQAVREAVEQNAAARAQLLEHQKDKVLGSRQNALQLRLLQDQIDGLTLQYTTMSKGIADMRQLSTADATNITSLGEAKADDDPVFPNPQLILGGAGALGGIFGILLAVFGELQARRVRSPQDLETAADAPVLGVMPRFVASGGLLPRRKQRTKPEAAGAGRWPRRRGKAAPA